MVFATLAVALLTVTGAFASPILTADVGSTNITERGEPDFILGNHNFRKRQSPNYSQNYIASGANVQFTPSGNSFSVKYDTNQDFVVGRGWSTGDTT